MQGPEWPPPYLQAALTETRQLCLEYSWLTEICAFVRDWGPSKLESMKGWPAEEYVNRILKLRTWVSQVQKVPQVVITYNCLLFVDCSGIHQDVCEWRGGALSLPPSQQRPHP